MKKMGNIRIEDRLFDPWEHMEEDDIPFQKMKPKVKKVKKEKEFIPEKKKKKRIE